jgi:hypothetical protein
MEDAMSYRRGGGMVPTYQRVGPDGLDLTRTRTRDDAATAKLVGAGVPVLEVSVDQSGETSPIVRWRNEPDTSQREQAEALLGYAAQHTT